MAIVEEPILSRLDRLDIMVKELEDIRGCNKSARSSNASTPSSGTFTSEGQVSSVDFSPKSLEKHCRPINHVVMVTELKGTIVERLDHVEDRVHKLEDMLEGEEKISVAKKKKKSLKQLVKKCVNMKL